MFSSMTQSTPPTIRSLADGLWVIDHPFTMPGGIALGARTTVVRLGDGGLWVHSPGPPHPAVDAFLKSHGPVSDIVAPNLLHHFFLADAASAWPGARVHGPAGLQAKLGGRLEIAPLDEASFAGELPAIRIEGGPKMAEFDFLHPASRTLILTDLAFNFRAPAGLITRLFLRINGALGRFGPSRLGRSYFFEDKAAMRPSVERLLEWDFDRVIVSHGEVLESGGPAAMRDAYAWLLR